jgi:hypothetical protein
MKGLLFEDGFLLYTGPINFEIMRQLISGLREKMAALSPGINIQKRASYVLEELLSNVTLYYRKNMNSDELVNIRLELTGKPALEMRISNTIRKADTDAILLHIEYLNSRTQNEIKELFQAGLKNTVEEEGGSGIGLISIRMRTGQSFQVEITEKGQTENIIHFTTSIPL